ncbi:hypothetical protein IV102_21410 [bacterium]|nr:hypothetical protein [bacterium]
MEIKNLLRGAGRGPGLGEQLAGEILDYRPVSLSQVTKNLKPEQLPRQISQQVPAGCEVGC